MRLRGRDWAFYVQAAGLVGLWGLTGIVVWWFVWRAYDLHRFADQWTPAVVVGAGVCACLALFASVMTYVFLAVGGRSEGKPPDLPIDEVERKLTHGVLRPWSWKGRAVAAALSVVVAWALYCWWYQLSNGLVVTGLSRPVFWALYITNFVFFIGISYGGTLVSAILRIAKGEWRRPVTRAAEAVAVLVLMMGGWNIFLDLGRPDRVEKLFDRGRLESPLEWDVVAISTYVIGCVLYLYLPLIPDLGMLRNRVKGWRKPIYHLFSFGWTGAEAQKQALERAISVTAVMIVPIAVSVHSVVGWVFALTVQPMWHSTILGPYFVLGAMFSGVAALILVLAVLRRAMRLQDFIRPVQFDYLGMLLLVLACLWLYFTISENLTVYWGAEHAELAVLVEKLSGRFAPLYWVMLIGCFFLPLLLLSRKRTRTVAGTVIASAGVVIGMWIERYTIVVPTMEAPRLPVDAPHYSPSWVELSLMAGCFAMFGLMYMLFTRLFPVVSLWEMREGREVSAGEAAERIRAYFPFGAPQGPATDGGRQ
ncbi:MAG: polysulfide reductase NrfD [Myxococcales bacterium]|nr:polysulfide reductase NrfD [Myxococcales bacterium]